MSKRSDYIGGSDSSSIINKNRWRSRLDVWQQKVHNIETDIDNFHIRRGNKTEPEIHQYVKDHIDPTVNSDEIFEELSLNTREEDYQIFLKHPTYPFIGGHPDGVGETILHEYKAPTMYKTNMITDTWHQDITYEEIMDNGLPFNFIVQIQHYIMILRALTGRPYSGMLHVWNYDLQEPYSVPIASDEEFQANLLEEYKEFWHYVEMGMVPPALTDEERFHIEIMDEPMLDALLEEYKIATQMRYRGKDWQSEVRSKLVTFVKNSGRNQIITENFHASINEIHKTSKNGKPYSYWKPHVKQRNL